MHHHHASRSLLVATSLCLGSLCALVAPDAVAEPTPAEVTIARRMYAEAVQHEKAEEWSAAEERLRRVLEIKATPGIYFHLAHALEQQGRLVEALLNYDRARELIQAGAKADEVLRLLGPIEQKLKARVPNLTVVAGTSIESLELDRQDVGTSLIGSAFPIDPGPHSIQLRTPDGRTFSQTFHAVEGQQVQIEATFPSAPVITDAPAGAKSETIPEPVGKPASSATSSRTASTPWLGYVFAGGALAAAGGSLYGFLRASSKGDEAQTLAPQCFAGDSSACSAHESAVDSRSTGLLIGIAAAGAAVGFGALATWQFWPAPTADETGLTVNFSTHF